MALNDPLRTLAPRRVLEHDLLASDAVVAEEATTLFVDLTGFTSLTEQLGSVGSRGLERFSDLVRGFFGEVTDAVTDRGGDLLAFGGDAITVVIDGPSAPALAAATEAATEIENLAEAMTARQPAGDGVRLRTRIGIARGEVATTVARAARRAIPVHLGAGLDLAVAAQAAAAEGRHVVDPSAAGQAAAPGHVPPPAPRGIPDRARELASLAPPLVVDRMTAGVPHLHSHRRISVGFVRFPSVSAANVRAFLPTVSSLLERVDSWEGEVVQVSGGDKGMVAMVVFGAPLTHDDDPLRAIEAMLRLREEDPSAAIGVATGPVYAALLGSRRRLLPTHVGLAVNTGARLMELARPGQLLVEPDTWSEVAAHVQPTGPARALALKGHQRPVDVRAVRGWRTSRRRRRAKAHPPLVGREAEVSALGLFLDRVASGEGGLLEITGDSGIGKTRLVQEALDQARTRGFAVTVVDTHDHPRGRAQGLWRDLLGGVIGVAGSGAQRWREALSAILPDAGGQLAALDPLLGVGHGAQPGRGPDDGLGLELARGLFADALAAAATAPPLLVAVENVERLSEDDAATVSALGTLLTASRVGVLTTRRAEPVETGIPSGTTGRRMGLTELEPAEAAVLAADAWREAGGGGPPPWLADAVQRQAGGHPLYVRLASAALHDAWQPGSPPPVGGGPRDRGSSLAGVLIERIDRLGDAARELLAVLAVAGGPCPPETVARLAHGLSDADEVRQVAAALAAQRLVHSDSRGVPGLRLAHDIVREAVYESMSHADRDRLHRRFVEVLSEGEADPVEIALHVRRLDDPDLGRCWFPLAAEAARRDWNLHDAVRFLERALPLLGGAERQRAEVELLELLLVAGRPNEVLTLEHSLASPDPKDAHHTLGVPWAPAAGDLLLRARRLQVVAAAAHACGQFPRCEAAAREAMALSDGRDEELYQRAAELLVLVLSSRGESRQAISAGEALVARALMEGGPRAVATAHAALGAALLLAGRAADATGSYEAALEGARTVGDVVLQVHVLSDLAGCAFETGEHGLSLHLLGQARALADRIGYRRHLAFNLSNEAQLRAATGDPYATACAAVCVQRSLEMGDVVAALNTLHTWLTADPSLEADVPAWRRARELDTRLDRIAVAAHDAAALAVAAARAGARDEALDAVRTAEETAEAVDLPVIRRRAALARVLAEMHSAAVLPPKARRALLAGFDDLAGDECLEPLERAELALERWRYSRSEIDRAAAGDLVLAAFHREPSLAVRAWLEELGMPQPGQTEPLPAPVGITTPLSLLEARRQLYEAFSRIEGMLDASRPAYQSQEPAALPSGGSVSAQSQDSSGTPLVTDPFL